LIAVGDQRQLPFVLGQQCGKAGNTEVLDPGEVSHGGCLGGLVVITLGELTPRKTCGLGQVHQHRWQGHIEPVLVERLLNRQ